MQAESREDDAMPNIDPVAKAWQEDASKRFGQAVATRRTVLKLTAVQLSERTRELGYPITRSSIARIEGNHRAGKIDLAELLVLAAALEVPPVALLYPDLPDGEVEYLPGQRIPSIMAVMTFGGELRDDPDDPVALSRELVKYRQSANIVADAQPPELIRMLLGALRGDQESDVMQGLQEITATRLELARRTEIRLRKHPGTVVHTSVPGPGPGIGFTTEQDDAADA